MCSLGEGASGGPCLTTLYCSPHGSTTTSGSVAFCSSQARCSAVVPCTLGGGLFTEASISASCLRYDGGLEAGLEERLVAGLEERLVAGPRRAGLPARALSAFAAVACIVARALGGAVRPRGGWEAAAVMR